LAGNHRRQQLRAGQGLVRHDEATPHGQPPIKRASIIAPLVSIATVAIATVGY
jgi:hypothetical protein